MRVSVKWIAVGMGVMVLPNLAMASVRVASTGISAHQLRTDWFYLGLAVLGLAGTLPGLWRQEWQPCGRLWWIVAAVAALAMAGGLLCVHAWSGGSFAHYDHGLPFPWIKGAAMMRALYHPIQGRFIGTRHRAACWPTCRSGGASATRWQRSWRGCTHGPRLIKAGVHRTKNALSILDTWM